MVVPPFYVVGSRVWIGEKPPKTHLDYPNCPQCGGESEVHSHRHFDSDSAFHDTTFRCRSCGVTFPEPKE